MKKRILLIITGSIAAYKALDLLRLLQKEGHELNVVMTASAQRFITPLAVASLHGKEVYTELFSLKDESEMGHIRLARDADLILIAPASANILAKMALGLADDLASSILLATRSPIMIAPAMNPAMWENPATRRNIEQLEADGKILLRPENGLMACGETGEGRLLPPETIVQHVQSFFGTTSTSLPLKGRKALVTSGPTVEPIDPVRVLTNRSSGKQGYAIATALAEKGAEVTLISGPVSIPTPSNVTLIRVETAEEMLKACEQALPADIAICTAAVCDWKVVASPQKIKKGGTSAPSFSLAENPDILKTLSKHPTSRPSLVIGFAAETENLLEYATAKHAKKGCDWLLANDVSHPESTFGSDTNCVLFLDNSGAAEPWESMTKKAVAEKLVKNIIDFFGSKEGITPLPNNQRRLA
jgi:phosphopantothenoylcysteine decarboxylase/phosphopantothenate--cysteine ligase